MDGTSEVVRIRGALDAALLDLRAVKDPEVSLADAERPLARSVALVYQALASTHDAVAFHRALADAAREAEDALGPLRRSGSSDPAVVRSTARLAEAVQTLARPLVIPVGLELQLPGRNAAPGPVPVLADEPRLLQLQRPVLEPAVPLAPPEGMPPLEEVDPEAPAPGGPYPVDVLLAEAMAAGEEEPAPRPPPPKVTPLPPDAASTDRALFGEALTEAQLRFDRARHFFEDLGMMSVMRRPVDGAHWRTPASVERRLLARLDAIVACGVPVFPELVRLLARSPIPDAELTWAAIVLHGMIGGDDMFDEVLRLVRVTDLADEACFDSVADALRFLPHPRTVPTLQSWLGQEPVLRRLALRALGPRGVLPVSEAIRALREAGAPELRREGARALPLATGPLDPAVLVELLRHPDAEVVEAALQAGLLRGQRAAAVTALRLLQEGRGEFGRAALYAAISSTEESRPVFTRAWSGPMGPAATEALGWLGDLAAVEPLLARLEAKDAAAVGPLQRLLGASLSDAEPEPEEPRDAPPFGEAWRPPRPFEILTAKPEPWRAWWKKHAPRAPWRGRIRWGRQFSLPALLWEIDLAALGPEARRLAHLELSLRTRLSLPLTTDDFVVRQEREVLAWRQALAKRPGEAVGRWSLRLSDV